MRKHPHFDESSKKIDWMFSWKFELSAFLWNVSKLTNCGLCQHLKWQMLNVSILDFRWRWKIKFNPFQDNGLTCRTGVLRKATMKRTKNMEKCSLLWFLFKYIWINLVYEAHVEWIWIPLDCECDWVYAIDGRMSFLNHWKWK